MTSGAVLDRLATLVVKSGVVLGGLVHEERVLALGVAAHRLARGAPASEAQVNEVLKRCLEGEARFLDADHVELRRWLVDTGWWRRDGFGRAYERVPLAELHDPLRAVALALEGLDLPAWISDRCQADRAQRDSRRAAWAARQPGQTDG